MPLASAILVPGKWSNLRSGLAPTVLRFVAENPTGFLYRQERLVRPDFSFERYSRKASGYQFCVGASHHRLGIGNNKGRKAPKRRGQRSADRLGGTPRIDVGP